ncbi:hypothetical protein LIER_33454 [Lithospermum erythrorhizon]|uniref:Uncharacterized protein n=1 Tax=Lithospermum erythrorhizon TaxID=34254 RepID=A0AAV3S209_LITER
MSDNSSSCPEGRGYNSHAGLAPSSQTPSLAASSSRRPPQSKVANTCPMPIHFYSDTRVLKAAGLTPGSDADLGALEALRGTYNGSDHVPPPHPAVPDTSSIQQPLSPKFRQTAGGEKLVRGRQGDRSSSRRPSPSASRPPMMGPSDAILGPQVSAATPTLAGKHSITVVLELEDHGEVGSMASQAITPSRLLVLSPVPPAGGSSVSKRSPADPSHEELISSFSTLGDKKRYTASIRRIEAVRAELGSMQAERDSAPLERDSLKKERESLCAIRDEELQSNDHLLCS